MQLTTDQRAYIVGVDGQCPMCGRDVEFGEVDQQWFICNNCVEENLNMDKVDQDSYLMGEMDAMSAILKPILRELASKGEFEGLLERVKAEIEAEMASNNE